MRARGDRTALILALFVGLVSSSWAGPPDSSWQPAREGGGIAVYVRDVADSEFHESLGQTTMKVRLSALVALILDGDSHHRWIDSIDDSRQLEVVGPGKVYVYTLTEAPWPVSDRDAVVLSQAQQDVASLVVTIRSSARPSHVPERENTIRIVTIESSWTLVPQPGGEVEVNYQVFSDPGGQLPTALINSVAADQPFNTLSNLRDFFSGANEYQSAVLPFIQEPSP